MSIIKDTINIAENVENVAYLVRQEPKLESLADQLTTLNENLLSSRDPLQENLNLQSVKNLVRFLEDNHDLHGADIVGRSDGLAELDWKVKGDVKSDDDNHCKLTFGDGDTIDCAVSMAIGNQEIVGRVSDEKLIVSIVTYFLNNA